MRPVGCRLDTTALDSLTLDMVMQACTHLCSSAHISISLQLFLKLIALCAARIVVYVCMYVCMHARMYVCMYAHTCRPSIYYCLPRPPVVIRVLFMLFDDF